MDRRHASDVRLDLAHLGNPEFSQAAQAVLLPAFEQVVQAGNLSSLAATTSFPQTSCGMPCSWQNAIIWRIPVTASLAFIDPGL